MWAWIIGFFVVCAVISVVIARRGPGAGTDFSDDARRQDPYAGGHFTGGGWGDGGGGS